MRARHRSITLRDPLGRLPRTRARSRQNTVLMPGARRRFGHAQDMETGGRPDGGVCAAVDVHYLPACGARAAAVLAADAAFAHVLAERTAVVPRAAPYRPGEFYRRELPPLRAVLDELSGLGLLVVDGYAGLDPAGPAWARTRTPNSASRSSGRPSPGSAPPPTRSRSCADPRHARCSSPPPGCPQPTRRTWSGAWPAGTGYPTHYAAPIPRAHRPARSHHHRPPDRLTHPDTRNAAEAGIYRKARRCINMQPGLASRQAVARTAAQPVMRSALDNRALTRLTCIHR